MNSFIPEPIDTSDVILNEELLKLCEILAENTHNVWAKKRIEEGWSYAAERDDKNKHNPCLVEYSKLSETEKEYDRNTALETLKLITKLGFRIEK